MSRSNFYGLVLGPVLLPTNLAVAGSALPTTVDIAGISLAMPAEQAKSIILQNNPEAVISDVNVGFGTQLVKRKFVAGYAVDITPPAEEGGNDVMRITVDPNDGDHKVFAISRYIGYPKNNRPVVDAAVANFIEKYGEPSFKRKSADGSIQLYWGALGKGNSLLDNCMEEGKHYNDPVERGDNYKKYDPSLDGTGYTFNYLVKYIDQDSYFKNWKECGTFLNVNIETPNINGDEVNVAGIKEFYMDFPAAYTAAKKYIDDFWAEADGATQKDQAERGKKKLKL